MPFNCTIQLIPKWPPFGYSFVSLQLSPCCLVQGFTVKIILLNLAKMANLQANKRILLKWQPIWNKVYTQVDKKTTTNNNNNNYHSMDFSFLFIGRELTMWPANNCLQISVLLQIMFCSCVIETMLLCENGSSLSWAFRKRFNCWEHKFPSESFQRENRTTFSELPFIPEIFKWNEPKTCVPFTSQLEFPEFLGKWKMPPAS